MDAAREGMNRAAEVTSDYARRGVEAVDECMEATGECVARHPASSVVTTLLGGVAIGFLAGLWFERSRRPWYDPQRYF